MLLRKIKHSINGIGRKCLFFTAGAIITLSVASLNSCSKDKELHERERGSNGIYHWKTTFNPSQYEWNFMQQHDITRLYIKMFDVGLQYGKAVPIVTTTFRQSIPQNIDFVPVVYITNEAVAAMTTSEAQHNGELIVKRLRAMAKHNKLGKYNEVQVDCDWSKTTRDRYFDLLTQMRNWLTQDSISLSVTLRLHQLNDSVPPVDKATLMLYNTGNLMSAKTHNSILDVNDVKPYLRKPITYRLPLDYAFPTFRWGVKYSEEGEFEKLISNPDSYIDSIKQNAVYQPAADDIIKRIRIEQASIDDIQAVKRLLAKQMNAPCVNTIIYHLDSNQLLRYSDNDIKEIFSLP